MKGTDSEQTSAYLVFCGKGTGHWKGPFFKELRNGYLFQTICRIICSVAEKAWLKKRNHRKCIINIQNMVRYSLNTWNDHP